MTKLLTSNEIEEKYFNKNPVLSTKFKEILGKEQITLVINTITYSYNWINKNISNCKNITYLGKEPGFIKLTTNHILEYYHPILMIYTTTQYWKDDSEVTLYDGTKMPKLHLGSWMDGPDRMQNNSKPKWATAWPLTSVIPWINSSIENKSRIGIDTALEYRTQRQIGNILRYYEKYGMHKTTFNINDVFITTKIPSAGMKNVFGAGKGVINPPLEHPKEYAINLIILNLLELGWITPNNITNYLDEINWTAQQNHNTILEALTSLGNTIRRSPSAKSPKPIDLLLLHHTAPYDDSYLKLFDGFELAKQANLITSYGFSNGGNDRNDLDPPVLGINTIMNNLRNYNSKINPVVIQQQAGNVHPYFEDKNKLTYQWVMTHCIPSDSNNYCAKYGWINESNTIIHSLNMNPALCKKYAQSDSHLPTSKLTPNFTPAPHTPTISSSKNNSSSNDVWYVTGDLYGSINCASIPKTDVYLEEKSYFDSKDFCLEATINLTRCNFNMNRENPCPGGTCWPGTNESGGYNYNRYQSGSGICVYGDAKPSTLSQTIYTTASHEIYTPSFYDDTLTKDLVFTSGEYNTQTNKIFQPEIISQRMIDSISNNIPAYYWIYIGLLHKPADMVKHLSVPQEAYKQDDTPSPGPSPPTPSCTTYKEYNCFERNCYNDNGGATCIDLSGHSTDCDNPLDSDKPTRFDGKEKCYNICNKTKNCKGFVIGQVGQYGKAGNCGLRMNIDIKKCEDDGDDYKTYIK